MRTTPLYIGGVRIPTYNILVIVVTAVAMVVLTLFLQRTKLGAAMQAVAMDHEAATACGIHVGRSNAIAFSIGAALAALAGLLIGPMLFVLADHGRLAWHPGIRRGDPRRLREHPRRDRRALGIGVIGAFAAQQFQGYSDLSLSWC